MRFGSNYIIRDEREDESLPDFEDRPGIKSRLANLEITTAEVEKRISSLKEDKSPGNDLVHRLVLKKCAAAWAVPLAMIF
ncbi:hypothetical protein BpHYR1_032038, partial [Brachionus plicatilis]